MKNKKRASDKSASVMNDFSKLKENRNHSITERPRRIFEPTPLGRFLLENKLGDRPPIVPESSRICIFCRRFVGANWIAFKGSRICSNCLPELKTILVRK